MRVRVLVIDIIIVHTSQIQFVHFKNICFYVRTTLISGFSQRTKITV